MKNILDDILKEHQKPKALPGRKEVEDFIEGLLSFMFPELSNDRLQNMEMVHSKLEELQDAFAVLLGQTKACDSSKMNTICHKFFDRLEEVYYRSKEDAEAICLGDPAAEDVTEVIRSYPGFFALSIYRIARVMWNLKIPYLPRIFSEYAHAQTGIEIHPGAKIGRRFCIDHGSGVVIGATSIIGDNVKIYQGVTLGALSVKKSLANKKRHPTIEDNVVIYANATILGGDTVVGANSTIGGNVWLTESVAPNQKIYYSNKQSQEIFGIS